MCVFSKVTGTLWQTVVVGQWIWRCIRLSSHKALWRSFTKPQVSWETKSDSFTHIQIRLSPHRSSGLEWNDAWLKWTVMNNQVQFTAWFYINCHKAVTPHPSTHLGDIMQHRLPDNVCYDVFVWDWQKDRQRAHVSTHLKPKISSLGGPYSLVDFTDTHSMTSQVHIIGTTNFNLSATTGLGQGCPILLQEGHLQAEFYSCLN